MKNKNRVPALITACGLIGFLIVWILYLNSNRSAQESVLPTSAILQTPTGAAASEENGPPETPGASSQIRINLDAYPQVLDPQKAVLPKEIALLDLMYEGLTRLDENLSSVPAAADSWEYNQDATGLTFRLRRGLKYSDGSLLNALRFESALQRLIDPATGSDFAWLVDEIAGASEWHRADPSALGYSRQDYLTRLGIQSLDGAGKPCADYQQTDCLTLRLKFSRPAPYFHYVMGLWVTYPVRTDLLEDSGIDWWLQAEKRVGNGPYLLSNLEPFVKASFTPNTSYHGTAPLAPLEFFFISDPSTALQMYRNNQLEIISTADLNLTLSVTADDAQSLSAQTIAIPGACTGMILFGMKPVAEGVPSPFSDLKVRQAFALAFNYQGWLDEVEGGNSSYGGTFIPWGFPGFEGVSQPYSFNPDQARHALSESTYGGPQAINDLALNLTYLDTPLNRRRFAWLAENFRTHLGVELALDPRLAEDYAVLRADPGFAPLLDYQSWCALYPDPQAWLGEYWSASSLFRPDTGYANAALQSLLNQANTAVSPAERLELYTQAHQLLLDDAPAIFGLASANRYLVKPWVKWVNSPFDSVFPGSLFPERLTLKP